VLGRLAIGDGPWHGLLSIEWYGLDQVHSGDIGCWWLVFPLGGYISFVGYSGVASWCTSGSGLSCVLEGSTRVVHRGDDAEFVHGPHRRLAGELLVPLLISYPGWF
jgi:hypothetical protein